MNISSINVHIEKLTLDGFDGLDAQTIEAAVRQELQRLLSEPGTPSLLHQSDKLDELPALTISHSATTHGQEQSLGQQIAGSVYRGINA